MTRLHAAQPPAEAGVEASPAEAAKDWRSSLDSFRIVSRQTGFMQATPFLGFLEDAKAGRGLEKSPLARLKELGLGVTLLLIFLGGIGLNLTPCVLPLIPINLAIIGAGSGARSRRLGFALGGIYGAGMALAYGALGLVVVLTGSKFGTLNSTISFNLLVAVLFVVLALGMFDLVNIDFSRFRTRRLATAGPSPRGRMVVAFSMGTVAALLAGACVAPVVISVLLLSTQLYGQGHVAGLLLPFLLGLGMALPWPFAGAGLTFLPKPGRWMKWTKYAFGSLILIFAGYYAHLALDLSRNHHGVTALTTAHPGANLQAATADEVLAQGLLRGQSEHRPVFVDFAASWCKNCEAMDETVFRSTEVQKLLNEFVVVRYQAERPNESPAREVLDRFGVIGLPTYVVLLPNP
jgi:thiol:disulfide interchange protein